MAVEGLRAFDADNYYYLVELKSQIGADRMLLGSDWPPTEGLAGPLAFTDVPGSLPGRRGN